MAAQQVSGGGRPRGSVGVPGGNVARRPNPYDDANLNPDELDEDREAMAQSIQDNLQRMAVLSPGKQIAHDGSYSN